MSDADDQNFVSLTVQDEGDVGARLDKLLADHLKERFSRARIQGLIKDGAVCLNGQIQRKGSIKVEISDKVEIRIPALKVATPRPQHIDLDIVYEDDDLIVLNKQAGLVVHPGAGNMEGTLVNALLLHCGDSLSGIGGVLRPGIVHRLDKDTSGLMIVAKHDQAHQGLSAQLADRSLRRVYHALVTKSPMPPVGKVDMAIDRDPNNRLKMTTRQRGGGRAATTHYRLLQNFKDCFSLLECRLESGRTHQIRVHMQALGHCLVGDPVYGAPKTLTQSLLGRMEASQALESLMLSFPRQALHAKEIRFIHPVLDEEMCFESEYPDDLAQLLSCF